MAQAHRRNLPDLTSYLRPIVLHVANSDDEEPPHACGLDAQEVESPRDNSCPLMSFARRELCTHCPYREQPVVSRESPGPAPSRSDEISEMIDSLFTEDTKKT